MLSRRFIQRYEGDDFTLYRALRSINPSPYLFYFDFGGFRIFGSSPETHCKIEAGKAPIAPIAGTTRRSGDRKTDAALTEALLAYLDDGHASDWLRSQKYTLDFIDYCLRLL